MLAAFATSALFLVSYVVYHANIGSRPFTGQGPIRVVYFSILITHVILAAAVLVDLIVYSRLKDVTVCYRCHAELRGFAPNPEHGPFDMHRAEEYDV